MRDRTTTDERSDVDRRLSAALDTGARDRAIEILVNEYGEHVYRYCRRMLGDEADADDVSQIVFMQAFEGIHGLSSVDKARAWLLGIARHRSLDRIKSRRRGPKILDDKEIQRAMDEQAPREVGLDDPSARKALDDCLDRLDARSRAVVVMRFHDQMPYEEIGRLVDDTPGALRVRVTRALPALRDCLGSKGVTP
jgi:RNA polymerase sigma-70 factor (ECF subfamily)